MSTFGDIGRLWQEKYETHFNFRKVFWDLPKPAEALGPSLARARGPLVSYC